MESTVEVDADTDCSRSEELIEARRTDIRIEPIKVLHLVDTLEYGGIQSLLQNISPEEKFNECCLVYSLRQVIPKKNLPSTLVFEGNSKSRLDVFALGEIANLISKHRITILHAHQFKSKIFSVILKIFYSRKLRIIFHEHGEVLHHGAVQAPFIVAYRMFHLITGAFVEKYICVSQRVFDTLKALPLNKEKLCLLRNCTGETVTQKSALLHNNSISSASKIGSIFTVGIACRLVAMKGLFEFINAAHSLNHDARFNFVIAGDGPLKSKIVHMIRSLGLIRCRYIGLVTNMQQFYSSIDCLIIPSHWEASGMVALEGLQNGVPVIASDIGGLSELISHEKTGLTFKVKDSNDLVTQLKRIAEDSILREHLINNGRLLAQQHSATSYLKALTEIYLECSGHPTQA